MSLFSRLTSGLSKSSSKLTEGITGIFTKRKLDREMLDELEELLITADLGATVAAELTAKLSAQRLDKEISDAEVKAVLAEEIEQILKACEPTAPLYKTHGLSVILVVGVNGNGKTTTIGKLAAKFKADGKKVMLAAADTFRAAAVEQLAVWGERNSVPVITGEANADSASVAYRALERAQKEGADVLMIDTAGRLHNKSNLMDELKKIISVLKKLDADAPHQVLQVLDATTGQNALAQVEAFREIVQVNGLVITKLDGTAKGGVVVALARKFATAIHFIGVGEGVDDLLSFTAKEFSQGIVK